MTGLPRSTLLVVFALLLMGCVGTNTKPVSDSGRTIDLCSHVTGVWSGSHGDAITGTYSEYQAHHKRNGDLEIFFTFVKPGGVKDTDHARITFFVRSRLINIKSQRGMNTN